MIYLDNNATTHPLPEVVRAVADAMERFPGNPSSGHGLGAWARGALEGAREAVGSVFNAGKGARVIFTSCGTESINTAFSLLAGPRVAQVVVTTVEHSAVLQAAARHAAGRPVRMVPVSQDGALNLDELARRVADAPSLVSVALANNETGILTDVAAVAEICRRNGALLHVDAVQAPGKMPVRFADLDCDAASFSAHKFHGPPGCGLLIVRSNALVEAGGPPLMPGHQEGGLRGGTENLPAVLGTAVAASTLNEFQPPRRGVSDLRDRLELHLLDAIPGSVVHGRGAPRLPNTISLYCPRRNAAELVQNLSQAGVAVSSGAACTTGGAPSHVIRALGFSLERANSTLRLSLSRFTTAEEVEQAGGRVIEVYGRTLASTTWS